MDASVTAPKAPLLVKQDHKSTCSNVCQLFRQFIGNITVEPVLVLIFFCEGVSGTTSNALMYSLIEEKTIASEQVHYQTQVVLRTGNISRENPANLTYQTLLDDFEVERIFALYSFYTSTANMILSSLVLIMMVSFNDRINEKTLLYVPVMGCTLFMAVQFYCSVAPNTPPLVIVVAYVFLGLGGSFQAMYAFAAGYMINRFQGDNRTTRLSIISGAQMAGKSLGSFTSGLLVEWLSFSGSFSVCLVTSVLAWLFIAVCLPPLRMVTPKHKRISSEKDIDRKATSFWKENRFVLVIETLCVLTSVIAVGKLTIFDYITEFRNKIYVKDLCHL